MLHVSSPLSRLSPKFLVVNPQTSLTAFRVLFVVIKFQKMPKLHRHNLMMFSVFCLKDIFMFVNSSLVWFYDFYQPDLGWCIPWGSRTERSWQDIPGAEIKRHWISYDRPRQHGSNSYTCQGKPFVLQPLLLMTCCGFVDADDADQQKVTCFQDLMMVITWTCSKTNIEVLIAKQKHQ